MGNTDDSAPGREWPINKFITLIDDGAAVTFDIPASNSSLSLLPADVPKVHAALGEWMQGRRAS